MRIIYAVSSIGLGHIARSRAIAEALKRRYNVEIDFIAPPPVFEYLEAWGWRPHPVSYALRPISHIVDEYYDKTGKGLINLRMALREHEIAKENALIMEREVSWEKYDALIADESWEVLESWKILSMPLTKIYLTDFIHYTYKLGTLLPAYSVNKFLKKRLEKFDKGIFLGFPNKISGQKWFFLKGERIDEWVKNRFHIVGPVPPVLKDEILDREEAREELGLNEEDKTLVVTLGGTSAGYHLINKTINALAQKGLREIKYYIAPGINRTVRKITEKNKLLPINQYLLSRIIKAFDTAVSLAGLTSISLYLVSRTPAILVPLKDHFEQEENAEEAKRVWNGFKTIRWQDLNTESLAANIRELLSQEPDPPKEDYADNPYRIAELIAQEIKQNTF